MPRAKGGSIPPPCVRILPGHGGSIAELNVHDVLSGRGGRINNHPGNVAFRTIVEDYKKEYLDPRTRKLEKAHVAARLVSQIRGTRPSGRFLREDPGNKGMYVEIGDQKAWKKAGQAMREDAPDIRQEIGKDIMEKPSPLLHPAPPLAQYASRPQQQQQQQQQQPYQQQQQQQPYQPQQRQQPYQHQQRQPPHPQHNHRPGIPAGIPPSVSYSPSSTPVPLAPPSAASGPGGGGARPDPPEAVGVTGYRQPPLRYIQSGSGRGGRGGAPIGRRMSGQGVSGRGGGPRYPPFPGPAPQQQGYHHQGFYNRQPQYSPHGPGYSGGPPGPPRAPPGGGPPQFQQPSAPYPHHPQPPAPYPAQGPGHRGPLPPPQSKPPSGAAPPQDNGGGGDGKHPRGKKLSHGVHKTMDFVTNLASKVAHPPSRKGSTMSSGFKPFQSVATDFTMSDISAIDCFGDSFKGSASSGGTAAPSTAAVGGTTRIVGGPSIPEANAATVDPNANPNPPLNKQSTNTRSSSSSKSRDLSFNMSDLLGSTGLLGRTRSFPDLMLSTADLLPPLQSDVSDSDREGEKKERRPSQRKLATAGGRVLHGRQSSSGSSDMGGFHPVGSRPAAGGGNHATGGHGHCAAVNDAMSIMSLDSRRSAKSFRSESSWLDNFRSMQSVHSDQMKEEGIGMSLVRPSLNDGSTGSVQSFLSDVSTELDALDLAEPLLPPMLNDSGGDFMLTGPDL